MIPVSVLLLSLLIKTLVLTLCFVTINSTSFLIHLGSPFQYKNRSKTFTHSKVVRMSESHNHLQPLCQIFIFAHLNELFPYFTTTCFLYITAMITEQQSRIDSQCDLFCKAIYIDIMKPVCFPAWVTFFLCCMLK